MLTAQALFERHFLPLYPEDARKDLLRPHNVGALPPSAGPHNVGATLGQSSPVSFRTTDANPANNPAILEKLEEIAVVFSEMGKAALNAPDLVLDFSDVSVHKLAVLLTKEVRDKWLAAPSDGPSLLAQVVIHGAIYVGACVVRTRGAKWQVRSPLWESLVRLDSKAGSADLAVFQWWLKALSDDEIGKGRLLDRYRTHVEMPTFDANSLRIIAPADRRIPKLAKVRYDLLYKHLRAHVPELKSVGEDFPSPERFEEYKFSSLEFALVGEGRMLLISGANKDGLVLFWLDESGFQKSTFLPADSFPAPMVKVEGEKLRVFLSIATKQEVHEMLWWGP